MPLDAAAGALHAFSNRKIVSALHANPHFPAGAQRIFQTDRQIGSYRCMAVNNLRQSSIGEMNALSKLSDRHVVETVQTFNQNGSWMRRVMHVSHASS